MKTKKADITVKNRKSEIEPDHFYINPLTDFGIKKLFCSDRRGAERLLSLLRAFLPDKMAGVTGISFLPTELLGETENNIFSEKTFFCFLELSKFAAPNPGQLKDMEFPDDRHKWAFVLKNMGQMEEQDLSQEDEVFRGLFEDGRYTKLTAMEKKEYKKSVLEYADVQDAIRCAQENSLKQGIEQGIEQGFSRGREEATIQLVRSLLDNGFDVPTIVKVTRLAEEAILAIKEGNPSHK